MERKRFILILSFLLINSLAFAEVITFKSGKKIEGDVIEKTDEYIRMEVSGVFVTYYFDEIESVEKILNPVDQKRMPELINKFLPQQPSGQSSETPLIYTAQQNRLLERFLNNDSNQLYLVRLPKDYNLSKKYPLLIVIHGYGDTAANQIGEWKGLADNLRCFLLCPQFPDGYQLLKHRTDEKLIEIIEEVGKEFSIDKGNVFIIGFSGGAQFAHRFAFKHPDYVKAACILAAGSYTYPANSLSKRVKYYVAVGEHDERYMDTKKFYNYLKDSGYDVNFESLSNVGHYVHPTMKFSIAKFLKKQFCDKNLDTP